MPSLEPATLSVLSPMATSLHPFTEIKQHARHNIFNTCSRAKFEKQLIAAC